MNDFSYGGANRRKDTSISEYLRGQATLVVMDHAENEEELAMFLDMLGLNPEKEEREAAA